MTGSVQSETAPRLAKREAAEALAAELRTKTAVFSFDYRGLTVADATTLRRRVGEAGGRYRVVKNTTVRWAVAGTELEVIGGNLSGMTGFAWCEDDPVRLAKALHESTEEFESLAYKGGVLSGRVVDAGQFEALASLPGVDQLRAQVVGVIVAPLTRFMNVLEGAPRQFLMVLEAVRQKKAEEEGG